jgi:hypothetical protein
MRNHADEMFQNGFGVKILFPYLAGKRFKRNASGKSWHEDKTEQFSRSSAAKPLPCQCPIPGTVGGG